MKKLLTLSLAAGLVFLPIGAVHADTTLTHSDVIAVAPQLSNALSRIATAIQVEEAQTDQENLLMQDDQVVLGEISETITQSNGTLTADQTSTIVTELSNVQVQLNAIANRRAAVNVAINNISSILGSVIAMMASAH